MEHEIILGAAGLAFTTGGAAWAGVKLSLNGVRAAQVRIEKKLDGVCGEVQENRNKITAIDTRCHGFHPDNR